MKLFLTSVLGVDGALSKPVPRYVGYKDLYYWVASPAKYGVSAEGKERKKERKNERTKESGCA